MFPIRLNLLSPRKKKHLSKMTRFQFVKGLLEILLIVASIIGIILLGSQYVLQNYFSALTENIVSVNSGHSEEIREIRQVNHLMQQTNDTQKQYKQWTPLIHALTENTTKGITLDTINIEQVAKTITFMGAAKTREIFLDYQQSLEDNVHLADIISPISGLTQKEDISFSISATLK